MSAPVYASPAASSSRERLLTRVAALCFLMILCTCIATDARADLAGRVYRIEYENAGVEDCLRFNEDGRFAADSSLLLPPGLWAQRGPVYTAYQSDTNGNTFTWGGAQRVVDADDRSLLIGAFVSSFGFRLGFLGAEDPDCEVDFDVSPSAAATSFPVQALAGEEVYEIRSRGGTLIDCLRLSPDGRFTADSLAEFGFPAGAWHRRAIAFAAYHSGEVGERFVVNSWGGLALAGGALLLGVDNAGEGFIGRPDAGCTLQAAH